MTTTTALVVSAEDYRQSDGTLQWRPAPCVRCGTTNPRQVIVEGGYACLGCLPGMPPAALPAGWPMNIPADWPTRTAAATVACQHCGRRGGQMMAWPGPDDWTCAPGRLGCLCQSAACCGPVGRDERVAARRARARRRAALRRRTVPCTTGGAR